jgi:hypothetical protein
MTLAGFPHSGITGSQPACGSPMLFAAYHALHRLSVPRHPPCALVRLTGIVFVPRSRTHTPGSRRNRGHDTHASRCSSGPKHPLLPSNPNCQSNS